MGLQYPLKPLPSNNTFVGSVIVHLYRGHSYFWLYVKGMGGVLTQIQIILTALFGSATGPPRTQPRPTEFPPFLHKSIAVLYRWRRQHPTNRLESPTPLRTSAAVWFKSPSTWISKITQIVLNLKVSHLL